jgi:hypothetical protein
MGQCDGNGHGGANQVAKSTENRTCTILQMYDILPMSVPYSIQKYRKTLGVVVFVDVVEV